MGLDPLGAGNREIGGLPLFYWERVLHDLPFDFEVPVTFFEKADAGAGRTRRIGGLISTESKDKHGETLLQRGLDLEPFAKRGWYNDDHDKKVGGIIGFPDKVQQFKKGETLPNGETAKTNGTWAEGSLLNSPRATEVWELGKALQGTGRSLGFSVEGSISRRAGPDAKLVTKATVRNVAITGCSVNNDTNLEILAKSLDAFEKALTMGPPDPKAPVGSKTGEGAGAVLAREDLDKDDDDDDETKKSFSDAEAIAWVQARMPDADLMKACRIVELTKNLKRQSRL